MKLTGPRAEVIVIFKNRKIKTSFTNSIRVVRIAFNRGDVFFPVQVYTYTHTHTLNKTDRSYNTRLVKYARAYSKKDSKMVVFFFFFFVIP